jgi:hypothetical protein
MSEKNREQKQYDHRLRERIWATGDLNLAMRHGVPRSTARGWLKQARTDVVSIDVLDMDAEALQREVLTLRRRVSRLFALLHFVVVAMKVTECFFERIRIPDGVRKQKAAACHQTCANTPATPRCHATDRNVEHSVLRMAE